MTTNNFPFSKRELLFKNPMTAAVAIGRLAHHSVILELNVPGYRLSFRCTIGHLEAARRQQCDNPTFTSDKNLSTAALGQKVANNDCIERIVILPDRLALPAICGLS